MKKIYANGTIIETSTTYELGEEIVTLYVNGVPSLYHNVDQAVWSVENAYMLSDYAHMLYEYLNANDLGLEDYVG